MTEVDIAPESNERNLAPSRGARDEVQRALVGTLQGAPPLDARGPLAAPLAPEDAPAHGGQGLSLAALLRFKWTMLGVAALVGGVAVPLAWNLNPPRYQAIADIKVEPVEQSLSSRSEDSEPILYYQSYLSTQAETIRNRSVLDKVLDRPEVQRTDWYAGPRATLLTRFQPPAPPRDRLAADLKVIIPPQSQLLRIIVEAYKPGDARVIADCIAEEYLRHVAQTRFEQDNELLSPLESLRRPLELQIQGLTQDVMRLQKDLQTTAPDALVVQRRTELEGLTWRRGETERNLQMARAALEKLASATAPAATQPAELRYMLDEEWRRLAAAADEADHQVELLALSRGDRDPRLIELRLTAEHARRRVARRAQQLDAMAAAAQPQTGAREAGGLALADPDRLRQQIRQLEAEREILLSDEREHAAQIDAMLEKAQVVASKTEQLNKARAELDRVNARIEDLERRKKVPPSIKRLGAAVEPTAPVTDKRLKLSLAALAAAAAAGVGVGFVRLRMSRAVMGAEQVSGGVNGPFLGVLPAHRARTPIDDCPIQREYVRIIRTTLLHRLGTDQPRIVQVTSAGAGAGKSTFSRLLARSLASGGRRVVLVETDLRNPSVARHFGIDPSPGLTDVLRHTAELDAALRRTSTPHLTLLPSAPAASGEELERLANGTLGQVLTELRRSFDFVVLDSGPLLSIADAAMLAPRADGTILIVRQERCRVPDILDAAQLLAASGGRLLGTVFVGPRTPSAGGYSSTYVLDTP